MRFAYWLLWVWPFGLNVMWAGTAESSPRAGAAVRALLGARATRLIERAQDLEVYAIRADAAAVRVEKGAPRVARLLLDRRTHPRRARRKCDSRPDLGLRLSSPEGAVNLLVSFSCDLIQLEANPRQEGEELQVLDARRIRQSLIDLAREHLPTERWPAR